MEDVVLRLQGRAVTLPDVQIIRELIAANPRATRNKLSQLVCIAWDWRQQNGALKDQLCRSLMLALHRGGGIAYNSRYLIPPWVQVPHLTSHLLARMTRVLPQEWQKVYGHPVYFAETFVDTTRHRGTCYRAANWVFMGRTTGRGKNDQTGKPNRTLKDVLGLPLRPDFREKLLG
jgi:hypothetical protein